MCAREPLNCGGYKSDGRSARADVVRLDFGWVDGISLGGVTIRSFLPRIDGFDEARPLALLKNRFSMNTLPMIS